MTHVNNRQVILRHMETAVEIMDAYKGNLDIGAVVTVQNEVEIPASRPLPALQADDIAILFLRNIVGTVYGLADPFLGATRFSEIPPQTGALGISKLESALNALIEQPNRDDEIRAIKLLEGLNTVQPKTTEILAIRSSSPDPDVALAALAALLRLAPELGVRNLAQFLATYTGDEKHISFAAIDHELAQVHTPEAERNLELLSSSRFNSVRFGAMEGLRNLKDPHSTPTLALRLDDEDVNIRYLAVITLAEMLHKGGDYAPNMKAFEEDPSLHTTLWKKWWREQGRTSP